MDAKQKKIKWGQSVNIAFDKFSDDIVLDKFSDDDERLEAATKIYKEVFMSDFFDVLAKELGKPRSFDFDITVAQCANLAKHAIEHKIDISTIYKDRIREILHTFFIRAETEKAEPSLEQLINCLLYTSPSPRDS